MTFPLRYAEIYQAAEAVIRAARQAHADRSVGRFGFGSRPMVPFEFVQFTATLSMLDDLERSGYLDMIGVYQRQD